MQESHLGPVNIITFVDRNKRFVTTSGDRTTLSWDFDIPITIKYIIEPCMHSMPAVTIHSNSESKRSLSAAFDNGTETPSIFRLVQKNTLLPGHWRNKRFAGHSDTYAACRVGFSLDGK